MNINQSVQYQTQLTPYELLLECRDEAMKKVATLVDKCANGRSILILGENGTGKEVVAHALHERGDRKNEPLVILDCTNLSGDTVKSELFGHERGSFTGASEQRVGLFEKANGGTAFLDEIGEVPLDEQPRLLRVLQGQSFNRLGSNKEITSHFRLIAATNKDLPRMVSEGKFRQDLYYRLQTFTIDLPPLRKRMADVIRLANHFVDHLSSRHKMLHTESERLLLAHCWPGNVRELKNAIERGVLFSGESETIMPEDLCLNPASFVPPSFNVHLSSSNRNLVLTHAMEDLIEAIRKVSPAALLEQEGLMDYIEKLAIEAVLRLNGDNILRTSQELGIGRQTLYNKLRRYSINRRLRDEPPMIETPPPISN